MQDTADIGGLTRPGPGPDFTGQPVAVLAGGGHLPVEVARELRRAGAFPHIVAISGIADGNFSGFDVTSVALGQISRMLAALKRDDTEQMVIAGFVRRPDLLRLRMDLGFIRHLPIILSLMRGGDDNVMRRIARFFERHGLRVRSPAEAAPALLAPYAALTGNPDPADLDAAHLGRRAIALLAPYDVGQTVIVDEGALVAIEGVEGTDRLLRRLGATHRRRVFVKTSKPGQDLRLDLPTIGPETVRAAAAANVGLMAIEADRTLIVDRPRACAIAERSRMAIVGLDPAPRAPRQNLLARTSAIALTPVGPLRPGGERAQRDAQVGLALLEDLLLVTPARAVLVARQHILAVNVSETMETFLNRAHDIGQWGDNSRRRRNVTLVLGPDAHLAPDALDALKETPIAGLAFAVSRDADETRNALIDRARTLNLYMLERQ